MGFWARQHFRLIATMAVVALAPYFAVVVTGFASPATHKVLGNLVLCFVPLAAAIACLAGAHVEREPRLQRAWLLLGSSAAAWGLGQVVWTAYELVLHSEVPFPSLADVGYLGAVPFALASMLTFLETPVGFTSRLRAILEAVIIVGSVFFVSWAVVLGPLYAAGAETLVKQFIGLAYPLADVALASIVLVALSRSRPGTRSCLVLVGLGVFGLAVADSGFALMTLRGRYSTGSPIDLGWAVGFLLIGLAALRPAPGPAKHLGGDGRWGLMAPVVMFVPVVGAGIVACARLLGEGLDHVLLWDGMAIVTCLVAYQYSIIHENTRFTRFLEDKVADRTRELSDRERYYRQLFQDTSDVVSVLDVDLTVRDIASSVERALGFLPEDVVGRGFTDLVDRSDVEAVEAALKRARQLPGRPVVVDAMLRHRDGTHRSAELTLSSLLHEPAVGGIVVNAHDITERKELEEQLTHQALHDPLTGLANRALYRDRLEHALLRDHSRRPALAVLFIDIDDFKSVNDSLGHTAGDELLVAVTHRIQAALRSGATFARLGGDEFAVLIDNPVDDHEVETVADRILSVLLEPFHVENRALVVNVSIGIATTATATDTESLLRNADMAMYSAKASGKGRYQRFERRMHETAIARLELEADLRLAVERDELVLNYQPVVDLGTGAVRGVEALLRWHHPKLGLVSPLKFITLAEETGLILPIGRWVIGQACAQAAAWRAALGEQAPRVNVNVSGRQFKHPRFVDEVASIIFSSGAESRLIVLELTESLMMEDTEDTLLRLHELKELGVQVAMDDFGTGYSSLAYLQRFPVDVLKIDQSFVSGPRGLGESDEALALVRAIVALSETLGIRTVAEGVETAAQRDRLRSVGCRMGQGYLFSRPVPAQEIHALLVHSAR